MGYIFKVQTYDESEPKPKAENCEVKPKAVKPKKNKSK